MGKHQKIRLFNSTSTAGRRRKTYEPMKQNSGVGPLVRKGGSRSACTDFLTQYRSTWKLNYLEFVYAEPRRLSLSEVEQYTSLNFF